MIDPAWIAPARTALLLIDMQADFAAADGAMARQGHDVGSAQAALVTAQALAHAARAAGVPVVFLRFVTVPGGEPATAAEARMRRGAEPSELCIEGTPGAAFCGPAPQPGETIVTKTGFSAFARTGLADLLHGQGVDTLVLAGLTTECCVGSSAWDAFERDFHVFVATDACAAYEDDLHQVTLKSLALSGALLHETAEFITAWKLRD